MKREKILKGGVRHQSREKETALIRLARIAIAPLIKSLVTVITRFQRTSVLVRKNHNF